MDILQEGNLIEAVTSHHRVLKAGLAGKKTCLAEERVLDGRKGEKREFVLFGKRDRQVRMMTKM